MSDISFFSLAIIACALFLGGLVKGATGAGTPIVAVPVIAAFMDIRLAVVIMVIPNLVTNVWQQWQYRAWRLPDRFALRFAVAGGLGAFSGSVLLTTLDGDILSILLVAAVFAYIGIRIGRPDFRLSFARASQIAFPMGFVGGMLQGMAGISAPAAVSFLNAMRLERAQFISTVSAFFVAMSVVQVIALSYFGLMTPTTIGMSLAALPPLFVSMPLGAWAARKMSAKAFDRALLILLAVLSIRLLYTSVEGFLHS
ncbi:sulfite exporter TauE/SafE family protein [Hoeflea sp. CAU 1731]